MAAVLLVTALPSGALAYPRPGKTVIASVAADGSQANGIPYPGGGAASSSEWPALTPDGRYLAFYSHATNLVPGDTNDRADVFLKDTVTGAIENVTSAPTLGGFNQHSFGPRPTPDARYVAVESWNSFHELDVGWADVYVFDRQSGDWEWISQPYDGSEQQESSFHPALSDDGRFVAFQSESGNIVSGDDFPGSDVFVRDRVTGETEIVSVTTSGLQATVGGSGYPTLSADGRYVAFVSTSPLVAADTNGTYDVYRHDRVSGNTVLVSVAANGACGDDGSYGPRISADGSVVTFSSDATNLVPQDLNGVSDVYVRDLQGTTTSKVSVASGGREANEWSFLTGASRDGRYAVFQSDASNLVVGDSNGDRDVFLHDRVTGATEMVSRSTSPAGGNAMSWGISSVSADGSRVAFMSEASNLVAGDANDAQDIFLRDRGPATGIGELSTEVVGSSVRASGWAAFGGSTIATATDAPGDAVRGASLGGELTGASVLYRPEQEDLFVRLRVSSLSTSVSVCPVSGCLGGLPSTIRYGFGFDAGGFRYEARGARPTGGSSPAEGAFTLYRCGATCTGLGEITGGIGSTGNEVVFSIPATLAGVTGETALRNLRATSGLGTGTTWTETWDTVAVGDATVPRVSVVVAFAGADTPRGDVVGWVTASLSNGVFTADLDPGSIPPAEGRVWARACVGATCGEAAQPAS